MKNVFVRMNDDELRKAYEDYYIMGEGYLREGTVFYDVVDEYVKLYGYHGKIFMELDFLKEVAERYFEGGE